MSLPAQGTVISQLRIRGAVPDSLTLRQRLGRVLSTADLEPAGLPATAIVVIRTLRDPQPGRLRLMQAGQSPLAWQQAVGQSIAAFAHRAARPAHGFVADSVDAVVFMDRSELLACLARDWCSAAVATRWWWRSLVRNADIAHAVMGEWLQSPEYAPAALQQLAATGQAVTFVQRLDAEVLQPLLERVVEQFGLTSLRHVFRDRTATPANFSADSPLPAGTRPWLPWVPEAAQPGLTRPQENLLGITLLLQRAPGVARSARWADALRQYTMNRELPGGGSIKAGPASAAPRRDDTPNSVVIDGRNASPPVALPAGRVPRDQQAGPVADAAREQANGGGVETPLERPAGDSVSAVFSPHSPVANQPEPAGNASPQLPLGAVAQALFAQRQSADIPGPEFATTQPLPEARCVESGYGGALFLVNLGLFLDLYSDFSQPGKPGLELPIWDFVALLGAALVGPAICHDPLWPLLAQLAGRAPAEAPGLHFSPPPEWRMPQSWLAPFAATAWEWSGRARRAQVRHPAGFVVLDVAVPERDYIAALAAELAPYQTAGLCIGVTRRAPSARDRRVWPSPIHAPALRRWCGCLLPYVRARLSLALGVSAAQVGTLLCACPARLRVTATHFDVDCALANLPIEVRLAGLDRDPGWVPAAGRYIQFHFN